MSEIKMDEHKERYTQMQENIHSEIVKVVEKHVTEFRNDTGILVKSFQVGIAQEDKLDGQLLEEGYSMNTHIQVEL